MNIVYFCKKKKKTIGSRMEIYDIGYILKIHDRLHIINYL